ncbi:uncharacterized protein DUF3311 [Scopulibacillus darangshiensis]|uniref:Uncharacterized protein DUF3311 n=1 Tax=Scopulibacillus darangshiensis TaxID=442528 RepID=A0A4R2NIH3_9BACL|nr:DUF3311 domain-containing protein [Scopulibacillus darangshiensis]TCP21062.1 uncharacterized protein DUF3311 [Scopulibacillus darangshiensis]
MRKLLFLLSMVPFVGSLIVINRTDPFVLGLPFVIFWAAIWVVLTSVCLFIVYKLDPDNKEREEDQ